MRGKEREEKVGGGNEKKNGLFVKMKENRCLKLFCWSEVFSGSVLVAKEFCYLNVFSACFYKWSLLWIVGSRSGLSS